MQEQNVNTQTKAQAPTPALAFEHPLFRFQGAHEAPATHLAAAMSVWLAVVWSACRSGRCCRRSAAREEGELVELHPLPDHPVRGDLVRAQLRGRAVQHPLRIDAAEPDDRRLSLRIEMALRVFALLLPVRHHQL